MPDLRNEWWLAKRLFGRELCTIFSGTTDVAIRKSRMRAAIIERNKAAGRVGKGAETFPDLFRRLYGESIEAPNG